MCVGGLFYDFAIASKQELNVYGFSSTAGKWFKSCCTGRKQYKLNLLIQIIAHTQTGVM
jgi:hypothetical protein